MKKIILIAIICLFTLPSNSQTEEMVLPSDLAHLTIITEPTTLHKGFLRAGIVFYYSILDKSFDNNRKKIYSFESTWVSSITSSVMFQYGLTDRLTTEIFIPYHNEVWNYHKYYTSGEFGTSIEGSWDLRGSGLGDICLSARYQIIPGSQSVASLTGSLDITLPTGKKNPTNIIDIADFDLPTGDGTISFNPGIMYRKIKYPLSYRANISYVYNLPGKKLIEATDTEETNFKYGNIIIFGGSFDFHLNDWLAVTNGINFSHFGKGSQEGLPDEFLFTRWALNYEPRLVFQIKRLRLAESVNLPIMGKSISSDPLYVFLLQYTF